jgi:hypothetical protein
MMQVSRASSRSNSIISTVDHFEQIERDLQAAASVYQPRNRPWSEREKAIVKQFYGRVALRFLAEKVKRTTGAVKELARRIV